MTSASGSAAVALPLPLRSMEAVVVGEMRVRRGMCFFGTQPLFSSSAVQV